MAAHPDRQRPLLDECGLSELLSILLDVRQTYGLFQRPASCVRLPARRSHRHLFGGPLSDRFGKRNLLILSTLGALPLTLLTPYVSGFWSFPLLLVSGFIMLSSFSVTVVYAQELLPGKIGTVSGLIIGLAFGMGGMGALAFGYLADMFDLGFVITLCSVLPLIGLVGFLLPKDKTLQSWVQ